MNRLMPNQELARCNESPQQKQEEATETSWIKLDLGPTGQTHAED